MKITLLHIILSTSILFVFDLTQGQNIRDDQSITDAYGRDLDLTASKKSTIVLIFLCNSCPYTEYYFNRIEEMVSDYPQVDFFLVNSSPEKYDNSESLDAMQEVSRQTGLDYINDKEQELKTILDATKCPEAFILQRDNASWTVKYSGAIDDNPQSAENVRTRHLVVALNQVVNNQTINPESVRPIGCSIKKN